MRNIRHYYYYYGLVFTAIEDYYTGPRLEEGEVTEKFMLELMEHYKAQKKLHRRCAYKVRPLH